MRRSADDEKQRSHRQSVERDQAEALQRIIGASSRDHRTVLNLSDISRALTTGEVTKAFRQQSLLVHPDKNSAAHAEDAFKRLQAAYAALKEEAQRGGMQAPTAFQPPSGARTTATGYGTTHPASSSSAGRPGYARQGSYGEGFSNSQTPPPWGRDDTTREEYYRWGGDRATDRRGHRRTQSRGSGHASSRYAEYGS